MRILNRIFARTLILPLPRPFSEDNRESNAVDNNESYLKSPVKHDP